MILGRINIFKAKIKQHGKGIYIGLHTKIDNGSNIVLGNNVSIMPYNMLVSHENGSIKIGNNTEIGMFSRIAAVSEVKIGNDVITEPNIFIADYNHKYTDINKVIKNQGVLVKGTIPKINIGDETWIGTNVVIVGTVSIGQHCVIGANSVVTKDIPDFSVAVGNPAQVIKKYDKKSKEWMVVK